MIRSRLTVAVALLVMSVAVRSASAQPLSTAFTFQGELGSGGSPASGLHDLRFRLYDAASGGAQIGSTLCVDNVNVVNGRFALSLDFGAQFSGSKRYIEIDVRADTGLSCASATGFVTFAGRQELQASPYSLYSLNAASAASANFASAASSATTATNATQLNGQAASFYTNAANLSTGTLPSARITGPYSNSVNFSNVANVFSGTFTGNGSSLTGLWRLAGNAGTTAGTDYLGTSDNQPLELRANGVRAIRIEPIGVDTFNIISGSPNNSIGAGISGATICGGGSISPMDEKNQVTGDFGAVVGGVGNISAQSAFVGGGFLNRAGGWGSVAGGSENWALGGNYNAVAGGHFNKINTNGPLVPSNAFIGGGANNTISGTWAAIAGGSTNDVSSVNSFIGAGFFNTISGDYGVVGGGYSNDVTGQYGVVPGGEDNTAGGIGSFAAGSNAKVRTAAQTGDVDGDEGTFIFADKSVSTDFTSTGPNQFLVRAIGGVGINTAAPTAQLHVAGTTLVDLTTSGVTLRATNNTSTLAFGPETAPASIEGKMTNPATGAWNTGVRGYSLGTGGSGVGVAGIHTGTGYGIYGKSGTATTGYAGYFEGRIRVTGNLDCVGTMSKGGGSFKIDHPLDPENKFLYHSFVESPDMMNIYNGNITTDEHGFATVTMPNWFEALNQDFRYQLTVLDESEDDFVFAKVYRKLANNQFVIKTSRPGVEVSWMVTGIRHDAFANKNRIPTEVQKSPAEKGLYLHPDAFGQPESKGIGSETRQQLSALEAIEPQAAATSGGER